MSKFAYLRPVSDVSLQHTCSSGSAGYAMIDDETSDESSTYIQQQLNTTTTTATSTFTLTGDVPQLNKGQLVSAKLVIVHYRGSSFGSVTLNGSVQVEGESANTLTFKSGQWTTESFELDIADFSFGTNTRNVIFTTSGTVSKNTLDVRCTQIYIVVEYTAYYTLTTTLKMGHGLTFDSPLSIEVGENFGPKIYSSTDRRILRLLETIGTTITDRTAAVSYIEPSATYEISDVDGASYNFTLNENNYYESTNKAKASSAALCKITFHCKGSCTANIYVINYAEAQYDYGILGNINTELDTTYNTDSNAYWSGNTSAKNVSTEQLVSYELMDGDSWVMIKYRKDGSGDSNNDSLQFRVELVMSSTTPYYTYMTNNITNDISYEIWSEIPYIKINGQWVEAKEICVKSNGVWATELDICNVFDAAKNYELIK